MNIKSLIILISTIFLSGEIFAQKTDPYSPDFKSPEEIKGMKLVWNDEFNYNGKPDTANWIFENGFVRNEELQWYNPGNAKCTNGLLTIEGRKEKIKNPDFIPGSGDWRGKGSLRNTLLPAYRPAARDNGNSDGLK